MTVTAFDPRTGTAAGSVREDSTEDVGRVVGLAQQAAVEAAASPPARRAEWLEAIASTLEADADELVEVADRETALGDVRLRGEVARAAGQFRFYARVATEGSYLDATIDHGVFNGTTLARTTVPLGPVAVFGASNFPLAFGVLGNDTASALAAGCPVVVKAHPAHPILSERLIELAITALRTAGAPEGVLGSVTGFEAGTRLVESSAITAVAFTGSQSGGLALWRVANERDVPIPVFAEMGTVNPVLVTPDAARSIDAVAEGFAGSFTLGSGQFCTKPGLLLAPQGSDAAAAVGRALHARPPSPLMLTESIAVGVDHGIDALVAAGAEVVARVGGARTGWSAPAVVLRAPIERLQPGSPLLSECFGAVVLVVEYDLDQLASTVRHLQGALAGSVITGGADDVDAPTLIELLTPLVGRIVVDDWPTGVAFCWAQHHGGPWPSTSRPEATSVGAAALSRFGRPVTYQGAVDAWLPPALRADNPWRITRRIDGVLSMPEDR